MTTTKQSTFGATLRTTILLASLSGLLVLIGALIGGASTALLFLGIAMVMNLGSYFFSDKLALKMSGAKPIDEAEAPRLYQIVRELTTRANLPMPRLYMIPQDQPNAFATGRNPKHAAVAVTQGLLQVCTPEEVRAVLAHELAHVRNRDILISSIAAMIGAAISILMRFAFWFGRGDDRNNPLGAIGLLISLIVAPLAAMLIRFAISRTREFQADHTGAEITGRPLKLASALEKISAGTARIPMNVDPAHSQMFIDNPLKAVRGGGFLKLFSTHPPTEERIQRLLDMASGVSR